MAPNYTKIAKIVLKKYWNYDDFRPLQLEIIRSVLSTRDTLALLPTGGGKSICFQVPALCLSGVTIVISPLIALMTDQIHQLKKRGIPAEALHSGLQHQELDRILDNCIYGNIKLLYMAPERIKSEMTLERIKQMNVALIAVDEAHCVSQWGYDFRPDYLNIIQLREEIPRASIIALTATATQTVAEDIIKELGFTQDYQVYQKSFKRDNISLWVENMAVKQNRILELLKRHSNSIIYVRNRAKTAKVAQFLNHHGLQADYYHAGLSPELRSRKQDDWIKGKINHIVCTNAFGMGIDKADVRLVIHLDIPDSMEAYFQEAGRAGRDGNPANAHILFNHKDLQYLHDNFENQYPSIKEISYSYELLCQKYQLSYESGAGTSHPFSMDEFRSKLKIPISRFKAALKWLERSGYFVLTSLSDTRHKVYIPHARSIYGQATESQRLVINGIFRMYEGVAMHLVPIRIKKLSSWVGFSEERCLRILKQLSERHLIVYEAPNHKASICFLNDRIRSENLRIDIQLFNKLRVRHLKRIEFMERYVSTEQCRQVTILEYFDESDAAECMHCDNCQAKYFNDEYIINEVIHSIKKHPQNLDNILAAHPSKVQDKIINELRLLIDGGLIIKNGNIVRWHE